jgi:hypothetical protein
LNEAVTGEPAGDPDARQEKKVRRRQAVRSFLSADRTPMWFTLVALLAGAGGTYFISPTVNAQFEAQKIKSDFVIRNYADLRTKMEEFQGTYVTAVQKLAAGDDVKADVLKLQEIVGRVSAQNLSMLPMFTTAGGPKAAGEVNIAMNAMLGVLFANAGKTISSPEEVGAYNAEVAKASQQLVKPLLELYVRIAEVGRLHPTEKDTDLPEN